jgi:hypothetical protein
LKNLQGMQLGRFRNRILARLETRVPGENYLNVWNVSDPIVEVNAVVLTSVSRGSLYEQIVENGVK